MNYSNFNDYQNSNNFSNNQYNSYWKNINFMNNNISSQPNIITNNINI